MGGMGGRLQGPRLLGGVARGEHGGRRGGPLRGDVRGALGGRPEKEASDWPQISLMVWFGL